MLFASDPRTAAVKTLRILTIGSTGELAGGQVGTALAVVRPSDALVGLSRIWTPAGRPPPAMSRDTPVCATEGHLGLCHFF